MWIGVINIKHNEQRTVYEVRGKLERGWAEAVVVRRIAERMMVSETGYRYDLNHRV